MRTLYFDCFSGVSGDMTIGALIDLGVDFHALETELKKLPLKGYRLEYERVTRASVAGTKFHVILDEDHAKDHHKHTHHTHDHEHTHDHQHEHKHEHKHEHTHEHTHDEQTHEHQHEGHSHDHEHHHHDDAHSHTHEHTRTLPDIYALLDESELSAWVKDSAKDIFNRLANAEGAVHGIAPEQVHFHEVGAVDAIVDVVGACIGFELLGVELFLCSPLHVGQGFVNCAHGQFPIPAPGTLELLSGAPIYATDVEGELVTPTGAAIVTTLASDYLALPEMKIERIGYGAGSRDLEGFPNMLRLVYGEIKTAEDIDTSRVKAQSEKVIVIEANIDDMNPQIYGYLMDQLLSEGALDVYYIPIQMKKNRPGILLTVLTPRREMEKLIAMLFRETTTIGLRYYETSRRVLDRHKISVETKFGAVSVKVALDGTNVVNVMPEYEDCAQLAQQADVPLSAVQAAAISAFDEQRENFEKSINKGYLDEKE